MGKKGENFFYDSNNEKCSSSELHFDGAGDGNRTHVTSLEGWGSTIELHPHVVGAAGFEPATPWSQTKCATKLRYAPAT